MYAKALGVALTFIVAFCVPASARDHHHAHHHHRATWAHFPAQPEWPHSTFFGPSWIGHVKPTHFAGLGPRPRAWCGWFMRQLKGVADASFNLARNWTHYGHPSGPVPGAVAVWSHHVGEVAVGQCPSGQIMLHSGNDGHAVRTRCVSLRGLLAFRA